jgi:hypothetical protein
VSFESAAPAVHPQPPARVWRASSQRAAAGHRLAGRPEGDHCPGGAVDKTADGAVRAFDRAEAREQPARALANCLLSERDEGEIRRTAEIGFVGGEELRGRRFRTRSGAGGPQAEGRPGRQLRIARPALFGEAPVGELTRLEEVRPTRKRCRGNDRSGKDGELQAHTISALNRLP